MGENPRPAGSIKLRGHQAYRTRIGDYRVIYTIDDAAQLVTVLIVAHRRDVHRGF